jgi:hypothetical protein
MSKGKGVSLDRGVALVFERAEGLGIRLSAQAQRLILTELDKAVKVGTIETAEHRVLVAAATIAAGARAAETQDTGEIVASVRSPRGKAKRENLDSDEAPSMATARVTILQPSHVKEGWLTLSMCAGNIPPHRCFQRSVLERVEKLSEDLPLFGKLHA